MGMPATPVNHARQCDLIRSDQIKCDVIWGDLILPDTTPCPAGSAALQRCGDSDAGQYKNQRSARCIWMTLTSLGWHAAA